MTFDPLLPIGNDNEKLDWTLSSSLQNVTVSDMEVMANAFTRLVAIVNRFADVTVSSSRLHGDLLGRLNRTRIESEGIGLVLLGERDGHVGIYHSSQRLQHFVYAVHRSFVLALETHYCRSLRTSFLYYFDTE